MSTRFKITETEPTPLLKDFAVFVEYVRTHQVVLTPTNEFIKGKDLYELNQEMTDPVLDNTPRTAQTLYPLLHLFYHLGLSGKLLQKAAGKGGRMVLEPTERLELYEALKPAERYFFLLETLWVDADWQQLQAGYFGRISPYALPLVLEYLSEQQPGKSIDLKRDEQGLRLAPAFSDLEYFLLYFSLFGFWQFTRAKDTEDISRRYVRAESITPLAWGVALAPILMQARDFFQWNLPDRREAGEWNAIPGSPLSEGNLNQRIYEFLEQVTGKPSKVAGDKYRGMPGEPFFLPFVPLVAEGDLERTLPREGVQFVDGTYVFKVALRNNLWRRIEISAKQTLLDLHYAIQRAYRFDNDHLYSFFMDGKAWSRERFTSPYDDRGPHVDEVQIGGVGLSEGQRILYLFDYGDEWRFQVTLEEIRKVGPKPRRPKVVEEKGKAPAQYGY